MILKVLKEKFIQMKDNSKQIHSFISVGRKHTQFIMNKMKLYLSCPHEKRYKSNFETVVPIENKKTGETGISFLNEKSVDEQGLKFTDEITEEPSVHLSKNYTQEDNNSSEEVLSDGNQQKSDKEINKNKNKTQRVESKSEEKQNKNEKEVDHDTSKLNDSAINEKQNLSKENIIIEEKEILDEPWKDEIDMLNNEDKLGKHNCKDKIELDLSKDNNLWLNNSKKENEKSNNDKNISKQQEFNIKEDDQSDSSSLDDLPEPNPKDITSNQLDSKNQNI